MPRPSRRGSALQRRRGQTQAASVRPPPHPVSLLARLRAGCANRPARQPVSQRQLSHPYALRHPRRAAQQAGGMRRAPPRGLRDTKFGLGAPAAPGAVARLVAPFGEIAVVILWQPSEAAASRGPHSGARAALFEALGRAGLASRGGGLAAPPRASAAALHPAHVGRRAALVRRVCRVG